jgi:hypothetical protein
MNAKDILDEIHRVREKQGGECDFDPRRIGERIRERQRARAANGARYVSFAERSVQHDGSCVAREGPEPPGAT